MCLLLAFSSQSYALEYNITSNQKNAPKYMFADEELSSETIKDDTGHFQSGYFYKVTTYRSNKTDVMRMNIYHSDGGFFYATCEDCTPENTTEGIKQVRFRVYCTSASFKCMQMSASLLADSMEEPTPTTAGVKEGSVNSTGTVYAESLYFIVADDFDNKDYPEDISFYSTNLPLFDEDDTEAINAYINNGDYSGAINSDGLDEEQVEYDEDVEKPVNLRWYGSIKNLFPVVANSANSKGQITYRWSVPQNQIDAYSYDVQVRYCYVKGSEFVWTDWKTKVSNFPYNGHDMYDLTTGEKVDRTSSTPEDFVVTTDMVYEDVPSSSSVGEIITDRPGNAVKDIEVRVRNRLNGKCSLWVSTKTSIDNSSSTTVTDDDGNVYEDEDYYGQDTNNSDMNTYYDDDYQDGGTSGNINTDDISISGILGFIKSGFGLLGDYGIISLMSKTYLYLPASIWTILKFFVAMLVVIAIIGAIKEVL